MSDELERLSPRLEQLLAEERAASLPVSPGGPERLLNLLRAAGPSGAPGQSGAEGADAGGPSESAALPPAGAATSASWPVAKSLLVAAATGALGFAGGLAVSPSTEVVAPTPVVSEPVASEPVSPEPPVRLPAASDASAAPTSDTEHPAPRTAQRTHRLSREERVEVPAQAAEDAGKPAPPAQPTQAESPEAPDVQHASERQLIDAARVALGRGRSHDALVFLMGHQRRFPEGSFTEERELLAVEALMAQGRTVPAQERGKAFLARFPNSPHAPRVRALIGAR